MTGARRRPLLTTMTLHLHAMTKADAFDFTDSFQTTSEDFVARISRGITSSDALTEDIRISLRFPGWAGDNWNAIWDCVTDLSWFENERIVIAHADVPHILESDLFYYLELLADAVAEWRTRPGHRLHVVFPPDTRASIEDRLFRGSAG